MTEIKRHTIEHGIPHKFSGSILSELGMITDVLETGIDDICIAHILSHDGPCLTTIFIMSKDGFRPFQNENELPSLQALATIVCQVSSYLFHEMPILHTM